jgi:outer membrane protein OmpA-like peptidoglycan-associated protein
VSGPGAPTPRVPPGKNPDDYASIFDERYEEYLTVELKTGRLFWDGKEVVTRYTIAFAGFSALWAWVTAIATILAGLGAALSGYVDLNNEYCWVKLRSCKEGPIVVIEQPQKPPEPPVVPPKPVVLAGVYFDTDSAVLRPESAAALENLLQRLNENPSARIEIQGHTDATGSVDHNIKLSNERAGSVVQWLIGRGVSVERLTSKGFGPTRPIADNLTIEGRARNRRVEFLQF